MDDFIVELSSSGGMALAISIEIDTKLGISVSRQTVIRRLVENHFKYRKKFKVPELTKSQIVLRYNFTFLFYEKEFNFLNEFIIFSDEACFSFKPDNCKWWIKDDDMSQNTNTNMRKYPFSILIWAAISRDFKSKLIFIDKSVNDERYKKMLIDSKIFKELDIEIGQWEYYFQQDGATCHWTPKVMSYINRKARVLNEWPPNSPYLSPIENLWAIMKSRLNRLTTKPKNKAKLKKN